MYFFPFLFLGGGGGRVQFYCWLWRKTKFATCENAARLLSARLSSLFAQRRYVAIFQRLVWTQSKQAVRKKARDFSKLSVIKWVCGAQFFNERCGHRVASPGCFPARRFPAKRFPAKRFAARQKRAQPPDATPFAGNKKKASVIRLFNKTICKSSNRTSIYQNESQARCFRQRVHPPKRHLKNAFKGIRNGTGEKYPH